MVRAMILVLDTSTRTPVVAIATPDGDVVSERRWASHHRHGEELLQNIDELLSEAGIAKRGLRAVVVGTGPGSFTGLRIGLATAKTIAYSLAIPIVGVSSTLALAAAHGSAVVVTLPAGASDRYVHRFRFDGDAPREMKPPQLTAGMEVEPDLLAVDIDSAPAAARDRGEQALERVAAALARLGAARLSAGDADDVANLVPAYVAMPRGIARAAVEMEWSPDLR
jgi:tRNA threonylcarbamoyl adenosine modification protein YeaZ